MRMRAMDSYIDREFELHLEAVTRKGRFRKAGEHFNRMLAASLLLHFFFILYLLIPGGGRGHAPVVTFDLSNISLPPETLSAPDPAAEAPEPAPTVAEQPPPLPLTDSQQLSKTVENALAQATQTPELLQETSLGLGLSRGYFNSLAEGRSLRGDIRVYYFDMLRRLNEVWWTQGGASMNPGKHEAVVNIEINRDGVLLRRELVRSTGDLLLDRKILAIVDAASPFPALPPSYPDMVFTAPLKLAAPLNFLSFSPESP
jgi:protein TonB